MTRLARVVVPGLPHFVAQRGNRDLEVFFTEGDYQAYLADLEVSCAKSGTQVWAYALLPSRVAFILLPGHRDGLRGALAEAHRRHARRINERQGWNGHLWQERFQSFPIDESRVVACAQYIEQAPQRAELASRAGSWPWSSARAHLAAADDRLARVAPLLTRHPDWAGLLAERPERAFLETVREHARSGRPLGPPAFVEEMERRTGRKLAPGRRGRPRKNPDGGRD